MKEINIYDLRGGEHPLLISVLDSKTCEYVVIFDGGIERNSQHSISPFISEEHQKVVTSQIILEFKYSGFVDEKAKIQIAGVCLKTKNSGPEKEHDIIINPIFLKNQLFSDFVVKIKSDQKNHLFPTHKLILSQHSEYFKEILIKDPHLKEIELNLQLHYFQSIYKYLYTNKIQFDSEEIAAYMVITKKFKFNGFYNELSIQFDRYVSIKNFVEMFNGAVECKIEFDTKNLTFFSKFINDNFIDILKEESFKNISKLFLQYLNIEEKEKMEYLSDESKAILLTLEKKMLEFNHQKKNQ